MNKCETCQILDTQNNKQDVVILETTKWRAALDSNQQYLGKLFVTLLDHKQTLAILDDHDWREFQMVVKKLEIAINNAFSPSHFNWSCLMNIAALNGEETHVHWHLHPRYANSIEVNGEVFIDTPWYPRMKNPDHMVSPKTLQIIASKIKENLPVFK